MFLLANHVCIGWRVASISINLHMTSRIWWPAFQAIKQGVQDGHYFSIAPSLVRDPSQKQVATSVPLDRIVLESDSPALGPVKGQRNTPLNLLQTVEHLADLFSCSREQIVEITTQNALRLFPKLKNHIKLWFTDYSA